MTNSWLKIGGFFLSFLLPNDGFVLNDILTFSAPSPEFIQKTKLKLGVYEMKLLHKKTIK